MVAYRGYYVDLLSQLIIQVLSRSLTAAYTLLDT